MRKQWIQRPADRAINHTLEAGEIYLIADDLGDLVGGRCTEASRRRGCETGAARRLGPMRRAAMARATGRSHSISDSFAMVALEGQQPHGD